MAAVWIGILAGVTAVTALFLSFLSLRKSRQAVERIRKVEEAPRVADRPLETRAGGELTVKDLNSELTMIVSIPVQGVDSRELAKLEQLRHRHGAGSLDVLAVPLGTENGYYDEPIARAGSIPVLAAVESHPFREHLASSFADIEAPYTKLLVDRGGRVVARFAPEVDPRSAEIERVLQDALEARS